MRLLLFFDLPTLTSKQRNEYRSFVKSIKKMGFYMLQESVYVKMCIDQQNLSSVIVKVKNIKTSEGSVFVLSITEKQFSQMEIIVGDNISEVINSDLRVIEL